MSGSTTALVLDTAPATTPITTAEAKAHLRISHADDDTLIARLIDAAVAHVDATGELGRAMITQSWAQWVPQSPGDVRLAIGPFQSLTSVKYYDSAGTLQTATLGDYETRLFGDTVIVRPADGAAWPNAQSRADAIKLTYVAGFGAATTDVPQNVRHALLMIVAHWYETRETTTEAALHDVPMAAAALLGNERVSWYG